MLQHDAKRRIRAGTKWMLNFPQLKRAAIMLKKTARSR
jgi:hypothetical protein